MIEVFYALTCDECHWEESWIHECRRPREIPRFTAPPGWKRKKGRWRCAECVQRAENMRKEPE